MEVKFADSFWESLEDMMRWRTRLKHWFYDHIKAPFFRLIRGWDWGDIWNLYDHLVPMIYKRLIVFVNADRHGYPSDFIEKENWDYTLKKILFAFEWTIVDDCCISKRLQKKLTKKIKEEYGDWEEEIPENWHDGLFKEWSGFYMNYELYWELCSKAQDGMKLFGEYFYNLWD